MNPLAFDGYGVTCIIMYMEFEQGGADRSCGREFSGFN